MGKLGITSPVILAVFAAAQLISCEPRAYAQRPQFLDASPFSKPRRPPPPPRRGGFGGLSPLQERPGQVLNGPPPALSPGFNPQPFHDEQSEQSRNIGQQLPLQPRPEFEYQDFDGPEVQDTTGQEEELEGGFIPLFIEEVEEPDQRQAEQEPQAEERSSPGPLPAPTISPELHHSGELQKEQVSSSQQEEHPQSREEISYLDESLPQFSEPDHPYGENQKFEEQETQDIEFLSAPPPTLRRRNPARHRRPAHPNQIPVYNVREQAQNAGSNQQYLPQYAQQGGGGEIIEGVAYEEEEEDEDEPDRLAILLLESKFSCFDKKNGYYADEDVQCEVFHYCQDRVKHSWLCPEGASFHQVHLICMPRSEDNICERSSTFHFVNDFLYKELQGPNKTTYADRYYPEGFEDGVAGDEVKQEAAGASTAADGDGSLRGYQKVAQPNNVVLIPHKTRRPATTYQEQNPTTYQPEVEVPRNTDHSEQQSYPSGQGITDRVQHSSPDFQSTQDFQSKPDFQSRPDIQSRPELQSTQDFQSRPDFQSTQHFSGQQVPSFQSPHDFPGSGPRPFASFNSPENVRVQRPRPRPQFKPGRRPGNFNRYPVQIG